LKDLRKVAKDLGELTDDNVLQEMIERADFDGDTVVSEDEFYNLLTKKVYWETQYGSLDIILKNDSFHLIFNLLHFRLNINILFRYNLLIQIKINWYK